MCGLTVQGIIQFYDIADQNCRNDAAFPHAFEFPNEDEADDSSNDDIQYIKKDLDVLIFVSIDAPSFNIT